MKYFKNIGLISTDSSLRLTFGADRQSIRNQLQFDPKVNFGRTDKEDSYENVFSQHWIRLSFTDDKLCEIEILRGSVEVDDVEVKINGQLDTTVKALKERGHDLKMNIYGFTDFENLFDIGDSDKNGGERNKICWFYTSTDFEHLKDL